MQQPRSLAQRGLFRPCVLAAALALAFGGAAAQDAAKADELRVDLATPQSGLRMALGEVSAPNRRFGQHTGREREGVLGLASLDLIRRDDATGTWLRLSARNLGRDNAERRFTHERQGDWSYTLQGSQGTSHEPLAIVSGLQGVGTGTQVVSAAAAKRPLDLQIQRDAFALGARKCFLGGFDVQLSFMQEDGKGARLFCRGSGNVMEFLTEPIDRVTRQWQALLSYADRRLQLSGGYSGSSCDNLVPELNASGGNTTVFGALWAHALPPGNSAHQLHLAGATTSARPRAPASSCRARWRCRTRPSPRSSRAWPAPPIRWTPRSSPRWPWPIPTCVRCASWTSWPRCAWKTATTARPNRASSTTRRRPLAAHARPRVTSACTSRARSGRSTPSWMPAGACPTATARAPCSNRRTCAAASRPSTGAMASVPTPPSRACGWISSAAWARRSTAASPSSTASAAAPTTCPTPSTRMR
ncbi:exported hypothetical protein [Rubrivivax sp. A210]|nr:exported hypothetical protein [Rubrivivax sp. A210]